ncbi:MAG: hypothetical protein HPY45_13090 [Anaerolineae bacterium]|nr:hypothetical protein [Anaerolineae bacterium]
MLEDAIVHLAAEQEEVLLNCIVVAPKTVSQIIGVQPPKVSEAAKRFWHEFSKQKDTIMASDDDTATLICLDCVFSAGATDKYLKSGRYALEGTTAEEAVREALKKLDILRQGWAALRIIQKEVETWA